MRWGLSDQTRRLTGRRFKFANQRDAALFKLFFPTVL
jgi:hypothetical protein